MFQNFLRFIKRPTSLHIIINTFGNYLNVGFSVFFVFLFARVFDKQEMGIFTVLFGISYVLANILDFGTTATIYSYLPLLIDKKTPELYRFVKSTFFFQSLLSSIAVIILCFFFPYFDKVFFKTGAPVSELYLISFSVLFFVWQNFIANCLYSAKKVVEANIYSLIANIIKTGIIIYIAIIGKVTVGWTIFVFGIIGPFIFIILILFDKKNHIQQILKASIHIKDFRFGYTLTFFISSQFVNLGLRMDLFLVSYYLSRDIVGYYGLSQKIILTIIATIVSITQVISPTFSKMKTQKDVRSHIKSSFLYMSIPTLLFILLSITPQQLFSLFFTGKFAGTAEVSHLLAIPYIIYPMLNIGYILLLYTFKKTGYLLIGSFLFFLIVTTGSYYYIPVYGYIAAIRSLGLSFSISGLFFLIMVIREYQKLPKV